MYVFDIFKCSGEDYDSLMVEFKDESLDNGLDRAARIEKYYLDTKEVDGTNTFTLTEYYSEGIDIEAVRAGKPRTKLAIEMFKNVDDD